MIIIIMVMVATISSSLNIFYGVPQAVTFTLSGLAGYLVAAHERRIRKWLRI